MKYKTIFDESKYGKLDLAIAVELTKEYVKLTYNDTKEITIFGYPALDMDCTECYGFGYLDKQKNAIETEPQPNLGDLVAVSDESSKEELNWLLRVGSY